MIGKVFLRRLMASVVAVPLVFCCSMAVAGDKVFGSVKLRAVLDEKPAFTKVEWRIYRSDSKKQVAYVPRHSAHLNLAPGKYQAVALLGDKQRSKYFKLEANATEDIVLSMD